MERLKSTSLSERSQRNGVRWLIACGTDGNKDTARAMEEIFNKRVEERAKLDARQQDRNVDDA